MVPGWLAAQSASAMPSLRRARAARSTATGLTSVVSSPPLEKFVQNLRGVFPLDPNGIPVAVPDGSRSYLHGRLVAAHYTMDIAEFDDVLHPAMAPTALWGFHSLTNLGGTPPQRHLGGILIGERGKPIQITFRNRLPAAHILPVDTTLMGADDAPNRTCVHFHGGFVPWISDGGPFAWFRPRNAASDHGPFYGPSAEHGSMNIYRLLNPTLRVGEAEYYYPLDQSARFGWYHDHAVGITRLNAYAGIASGMLIRDRFERSLVATRGLPDFIENGGREIPVIIQEKVFLPQDDASYPGSAKTAGSLWYPFAYDREAYAAGVGSHPEDLPISVVPEMFGDTMLVNGVVHPKVAVEPRRYRLRVLNATQARFLNLQLYVETAPGSGIPDFSRPGPDYLVIGSEGGFLARPVVVASGRRLNVVPSIDPGTGLPTGDREVDPSDAGGSLLTAPAERWDVVVDFSKYRGRSLILYNDAPAPFPGGAAANDGPIADDVVLNQRIMRFDVGTIITAPADPPLRITPSVPLAADPNAGIDSALVGSWSHNRTAPLAIPAWVRVRDLTLNELFDEHGRLIQMLGTNRFHALPAGYSLMMDPDGPPPPGSPFTSATPYEAAATETPQRGDVEVWRIANLTGDTHPMHFHLVNVQVLSRRAFTGYTVDRAGFGSPTGLQHARGPDAGEVGWKETVRMNPGEVTTVIMKFDLAPVPFAVPPSPRTGGNEFVWHCHILEHEEHDMMRPLLVRGTNPRLR